MNKILSDRFETPLGPMVLMARAGTLLLLEFEDATDRGGRESADSSDGEEDGGAAS